MGIDDIVRKANEAGLVEKAKGAATDERIDQASEHLRKVTPDNIDRHVDTAAEHAKKYNEDEPTATAHGGAVRPGDAEFREAPRREERP
jgi:hypothetical protein